MRKVVGFAVLAMGITLAGCAGKDNAKSDVDGNLDYCTGETSTYTGIVEGSKVDHAHVLAKKVVLLSMVSSSGKVGVCTGTPISSDVILTAAHCVKGAENIFVSFALDAKCSSGFTLKSAAKAKAVTVHPDYQASSYAVHDVALVKINRAIPADYSISEIYDGVSPLSSPSMTIVGYGKTSEYMSSLVQMNYGQKPVSEVDMKDATVLVMNQKSGSGICQGDSGGPVFIESHGNLKVIGVNSVVASSNKSSMCHGIGVAMRAANYIEWIQKEMPKM